ncbi:hypothetical protein HAX54_051123, partial [Datura stramonium]|nr:hypothetical protein [Datura stramonium]
KLKINWLEWILGYLLESSQDPGSNARLPYGMILTRIIKAMSVDVSNFPVKEISSTYSYHAFTSISYILMTKFGLTRQVISLTSSLPQSKAQEETTQMIPKVLLSMLF